MHGNPKITKEINDLVAGGYLGTQQFLDDVTSFNVAKFDELGRPHGEDRHDMSFGLSGAGACVRKAQLEKLGAKPTHSPGALWTFFLGHYLEASGLALLKGIGFEIVEPQAEVTIPGDYDFPLLHSWTDGIVQRADVGRCALSIKTMGYKNSSNYRGKITRRGFTALPFEGPKPTWYVQSQLEGFGLGLDRSLILVLSKEWIPVFETEDEWMIKSGSAVFWTELLEVRRNWVETFVLPEWRRAQWEIVERGEAGQGRQYDAESGVYADIHPATKNAVNGWNMCKWSTGQCDLYDTCLARLSTTRQPAEYSAATAVSNG